MKDVTVKKARKLLSPIVVKHHGEWIQVSRIDRWGKNWMVVTESEDWVVGDTYQGLQRVSRSELRALIGG